MKRFANSVFRSARLGLLLFVPGLLAAQSPLILDNTDARFSGDNTEGAVILMYHGLDENFGQNPQGFRQQMDYLAQNGYHCITLDHLKNWIETGEPALPDKPVVITFDDNYITVYTVAYPKMKALNQQGHNLFGYNYAHTAYVGVPPGSDPPTGSDHADWTELNEMEDEGVLFTESHTVWHMDLSSLAVEDVQSELGDSKAAIEANMGKTVRHLAYPYGGYNDTVIQEAEAAGYETATTTIQGLNTRLTPLYELRRYNVTPDMSVGSNFTTALAELSQPGDVWASSTAVPGYYGADYLYAEAGSGDRQMTWEFTVPEDGRYRVEAWWAAQDNRASNAPYAIDFIGRQETVRVDQRENGGQWNLLAEGHFSASTPAEIMLSNDADGFVIGDAIRVTQTPLSDTWVLR